MEKTPIQQAAELLSNFYFQGELSGYSNTELSRIRSCVIKVESLLPTEKEFAGKVFDAGVDYGRQASHHANKQQFLNRYYKP